MSPFLKNSLIIFGLAGVAFAGYYMFVLQSDAVIKVDNNTRVSNQAAAETQEFLRRLNELENIAISTELFDDPRFQALVDYSTPIVPTPVGRSNPFEPVF